MTRKLEGVASGLARKPRSLRIAPLGSVWSLHGTLNGRRRISEEDVCRVDRVRIEVVINGVSLLELESSYQDKAVNIKALPFHL